MTRAQKKQTALHHKFTVELTPKLLQQTMHDYGLKAEHVMGDYAFNAQLFEQQIKAYTLNQGSHAPQPLLTHALGIASRWPKQLTWLQFNQHVSDLLANWLDDYISAAPLECAFILARCLILQSATTKSSANEGRHLKFQSLLIHLLAHVTNQFDQYQYQYAQNFNLKTKLPNQHRLLNILQQRLAPENRQTHLGLLLLDLNINFHEKPQLSAVANKITRAAISTIQQHLNNDATLFHVSPNELAIMVEHLKFPAQINIIASQLAHAFEFALALENITLIIKPYFGGVSTFTATPNAMSIIGCAKLALQHAMINHHQIEVYSPIINTSFDKIYQREEAVITALHQNELALFMQPIVSLPLIETAKAICISAELLLRLQNKEWQDISPNELIHIIYRKGFGKRFIRWLINNACQIIAELSATHQRELTLDINISGIDLLDEDLPELIAQSMKLWGVQAENLLIEITESDLLANEVKTTAIIEKIAALGCKIALDDFGTGYSSMTRLRNMPINLVKIDQSFVRNIATSKQDLEIVASIIKLSHSLNKEVVAEGVEDDKTLNILKQMKCEKIQGYYYAKPLAMNEFDLWLKSFNDNPG